MRISGIVAEYNPFHSGHEKHILLTREKTGADLIVCAISGNFVQRGEPAVFDKWTRTACALKCGADAVLELPILYSIQSAEGFAAGGVAILDAAGAEAISFGCETEDVDSLTRAAEILINETDEYKQDLKRYLSEGHSFPKARMKAAFPYLPEEITMPNAILGIEYLKAILRSGSCMKPYPIKRIGEDYHSADIYGILPSATAIRKAFANHHDMLALGAMPTPCARYITKLLREGLLPVMPDCFDKELIFTLRREGTEYIKKLPDVSEGLENRIYNASLTSTTRKELIEKVKTKRYTYTRISRILLYALLGITRNMIAIRNHSKIDHIRVLGVKNAGVLSALSKTARVPLVVGSITSSSYPDIDIIASNLYALCQKKAPFCTTARDFTEKLIIE
ncbi:MAG: nucleotidyltransferase family protein [Christensenellales bacterium]|jgi:predicted nucleotidyltransferase